MASKEIILQDFTSMKASKTENQFQTGFQQPKSGFKKPSINILSDNLTGPRFAIHVSLSVFMT